MLVEHMARPRPNEDLAHEPVSYIREIQYSPETDKIPRVGVMLDMQNGVVVFLIELFILRGCQAGHILLTIYSGPVRVVEVVGSIAECKDLKFAEMALRYFV